MYLNKSMYYVSFKPQDGCFVPLMANHAVLSLRHQKQCPYAQPRTIICVDPNGNICLFFALVYKIG